MTGVQTCALPICFPVTICEGLGFLKRVDSPLDKLGLTFSGGQDIVIVSNPNRVVYEFIPAEDFDICFHRGLLPCLLPNIRNQYSLYYFDHPPTFEQFFDKLSANGKENIIYHLDLFRKVLP